MMLLLGFLLISMAIGGHAELKINGFIIEIEDRTLKSIRPTNESTSELNLSGLHLECLDKNAFSNLDNIKTLNLADNELSFIPSYLFANLTNLEYLSLADNKISSTQNAFAGLSNLKTLNISNSLLWDVREGYFYGLTKSTDIITFHSAINYINGAAFEELPDRFEHRNRCIRTTKAPQDDIKDVKINATGISRQKRDRSNFPEDSDGHQNVLVCLQDDSVTEVRNINEGDPHSLDCHVIELRLDDEAFNLVSLNIKNFVKGWYRLEIPNSPPVGVLSLRRNNIDVITPGLLNNLPEHIVDVSLRENKITLVERDVIVNNNITELDLSKNLISEIEDRAFENTKIAVLDLSDNKLNNTRFAATLPSTLEILRLTNNRIIEITPGSFSQLHKIFSIPFNKNDITTLQRDSLLGLSIVNELDFSNNSISNIEPGAFQHVKKLRTLKLMHNSISGFQQGVFDGLDEENLSLNLNWNKFTKISRDTLPGLPKTLTYLSLNHNEIGNLESGAFVNVPRNIMSLEDNKIARIEKRSLDLPELTSLHLAGNLLENVEGDSFEGLTKLRSLDISRNGISKINKGLMKNLSSLDNLVLSENPIKRLDNGAFFGFNKSLSSTITVRITPLELVQGGIFDDA